jgi:hypothetical protein
MSDPLPATAKAALQLRVAARQIGFAAVRMSMILFIGSSRELVEGCRLERQPVLTTRM